MEIIFISAVILLFSSAIAYPFELLEQQSLPTDASPGNAHLSSVKPYRILTPFPSIFISGAPYDSQTKGEYTLQSNPVNGYAVYQKQGGGHTWSFYQRANKKWYLDFNQPGEDWSGTVMYSLAEGVSPELLPYSSGVVVAAKTIELRNFPYRNGVFTFEGKIYKKFPVYENVKAGHDTFSVYRRANGKWYVDFNDPSEEWDGTVAYSLEPSRVPYGIEWNN